MKNVKAFAAASATSPLAEITIPRRDPKETDVQIDILFTGICHSDLHYARDEWHDVMPAIYPAVPGHEIVGRVTAVGTSVTKYKTGDLVGVGCMVDSDRTCPNCKEGLEQFCPNMVLTYGGPDADGTAPVTYGGYSESVVVDEKYVLRIPENLDPAGAAPLLCAGITTYSPMRHWGVEPGQKVGIVGLGGLGHMGVKFARAFGAEVVLFTTSPGKTEDAKRLGAHEVVISRNPAAMEAHANSFDFILNTVAASHNLDPFITMLKRDGTLCLVGAPEHPHPSPGVLGLIFRRRQLAGSLIGGLEETQEMLDFCGERGITSDIELIPIQGINQAYERMLKSDVKYRFVIDMASLAQEEKQRG